MTNVYILLILLYLTFGTLVALIARREILNIEDYFIGGRKISGIISALTYAATTYSAFMMVGLVGLTYYSGVGAAGFELLYFVGTLFLLSIYAKRIWKIGKDKGYISPMELLSENFGKISSKLASIIALIALIPYTSIQFIGLALILESCFNITFNHGIILATILIALWAFIGGLRGVAWTDAIQGIIMISAALSAVIWTFSILPASNLSHIPRDLLIIPNKFWTIKKFITFVTPWFFFSLTNPQVLQRLFIPKDENAIKSMVKYFGIFGLLYTVLVTLLGLELRALTEIGVFPEIKDIDKVTPTFIKMAPLKLSVLIVFSIIAASVTTANSIILTLSSMITRDIICSEKITVGKLIILILTLLCAIFALHRPSYIVKLAVTSSTILLCLLPTIISSIHLKSGNPLAGCLSILSGFAVAILFSLLNLEPLGIPTPFWVLFISTIFCIVFLIPKWISNFIYRH